MISGTRANCGEVVSIVNDKRRYHSLTAVGNTHGSMTQADAYRVIRRRAVEAGIKTKVGNHSFRATGITEHLRNGGRRGIARHVASDESARTTGLCVLVKRGEVCQEAGGARQSSAVGQHCVKQAYFAFATPMALFDRDFSRALLAPDPSCTRVRDRARPSS